MSKSIYDHFYTVDREQLENEFNKPMPLIGVYIAVASLVCTIAMVADTLQSCTRGKLWFPCRFFALNAASLAVIAVSMKLPVDLNNPMYGRLDQLAKFSSLVFVCAMLANLMPSIGAMDDMELLMHMVALAIMVITIFVNLCIQISTEMIVPASKQLFVVTNCFMLLVLMIMSCSALTVSVSKKVLERRYQEVHREIVDSDKDCERTQKHKVKKLQDDVTKYWIMATTSSPQFVIVCSEACCACGVICVMADVFLMLSTLTTLTYDNVRNCESVYGRSILVILIVQCVGVVVGSIAPILRLFAALSFKLTTEWSKNYLQIYKIESYWTEKLVQWKEISLLDELPITGRMFRKRIHGVKNHVFDLCIVFVTVLVVLSKTIRLLLNLLLILFVYCYVGFRSVKRKCMNDELSVHGEETFASESKSVRRYALQFHDGVELSDGTLKKITKGVKQIVEAARKRKSRGLMDLLETSKGFDGVVDFDNDQVPHLGCKEPPNGWSLPVITLTSIAMALPNIQKREANRLLNSVKKGLSYVKHVEENLDCKGDFVIIRKASDVMWHGLELSDMWLKNNLKNKSLRSKESTLQWLSDKAEAIVIEEKISNRDQENPDGWSINGIAANSMYRICQTVMLGCQGSETETDEELFKRLKQMIADILCACFTNLPRVICKKCYSSTIEKREESVRTAACLLGETEEILKVLSQRDLPSLALHQMAYIDEWRRSIKLQM